jgi:signal transduction histidine kinase
VSAVRPTPGGLRPSVAWVGVAGLALVVTEGAAILAAADPTPYSPGLVGLPASIGAAVAYMITGGALGVAAVARALEPEPYGRMSTAAATVACSLGWSAVAVLVWPGAPPLVRLVAVGVAALLPVGLLHMIVALRGARTRRSLLTALYVTLAFLALGWSLVTDPFRDPACRTTCDVRAILVVASPAASQWLGKAVLVGSAASAAAAGVLALAGAAPLSSRTRTCRAALGVAAIATGIELTWALLPDVRPLLGPPPELYEPLLLARCGALSLLAGMLVLDAGHRARTRDRLRKAMTRLAAAESPGGLREALAAGLSDPGVRVAYRLPNSTSWVNESGSTVEEAVAATSTATITRNGEPIARVTLGRSGHDPADVETVAGAAARLTIENERILASSRAQLRQLRESRQRIVEALDAARRGLERDLHDGAQQRLLAATYELRRAIDAARDDGDGTAAALTAELDGVLSTLDVLRDVAHGAYPPVLADSGLVPALESLARRSLIPLTIHASVVRRLDPSVELTAYLAARMAVAQDKPVSVTASVTHSGGVLSIEITGTPTPRLPREIVDRVGALGGSVHDEPHRIRLEMPCA